MAVRILPGVYTSLNDLSQLPEGQTSLTVGYVLAAEKGKVNEAQLVTSPSDFLAKYTFNGEPPLGADPTYHDIIKVLAQTNQMYIVRAADDPKYGTAVVQTAKEFVNIISVDGTEHKVVFEGKQDVIPGMILSFALKRVLEGNYTVADVATEGGNTVVTLDTEEETPSATFKFDIVSMQVVTEGYEQPVVSYVITVNGNLLNTYKQGDTFHVTDCSVEANNKEYKVVSVTYDDEEEKSLVTVEQELEDAADGHIWVEHEGAQAAPVVSGEETEYPEGHEFTEGQAFLVAGVDQGAYNNKISLTIDSSVDNPDNFVYHKGADLGTGVPCSFDTIRMNVINNETGVTLETFVFSKDPNARTIDGESLYITDVVKGSNYIQIVNNEATEELPGSTSYPVALAGGSNGNTVTESTLVAALNAFARKTVSVSILASGSSAGQESQIFQQALMEIATTRKDVVVFLNSPKAAENATLPSVRAQNIVDYKKNDLASVSFYGTMYAPHVNATDIFNNRQVKLGAASTAVAGWLNVINTLNYPYAYAGTQNGQVTGVTCDWKIGDESGEAQLLNDASINYVAFDAKAGMYYMQCQNTLQIANSALRNLGAILNVLDIKEHFQTSMKAYLQLPITASLRKDIMDKAYDYLNPMAGVRFYDYTFQDLSTDADIASDTLRYLLTLSLTRYAQRIYVAMNVVNSTFSASIVQSL